MTLQARISLERFKSSIYHLESGLAESGIRKAENRLEELKAWTGLLAGKKSSEMQALIQDYSSFEAVSLKQGIKGYASDMLKELVRLEKIIKPGCWEKEGSEGRCGLFVQGFF